MRSAGKWSSISKVVQNFEFDETEFADKLKIHAVDYVELGSSFDDREKEGGKFLVFPYPVIVVSDTSGHLDKMIHSGISMDTIVRNIEEVINAGSKQLLDSGHTLPFRDSENENLPKIPHLNSLWTYTQLLNNNFRDSDTFHKGRRNLGRRQRKVLKQPLKVMNTPKFELTLSEGKFLSNIT